MTWVCSTMISHSGSAKMVSMVFNDLSLLNTKLDINVSDLDCFNGLQWPESAQQRRRGRRKYDQGFNGLQWPESAQLHIRELVQRPKFQWSSMTWVCSTDWRKCNKRSNAVSMVFNDLSLLNPWDEDFLNRATVSMVFNDLSLLNCAGGQNRMETRFQWSSMTWVCSTGKSRKQVVTAKFQWSSMTWVCSTNYALRVSAIYEFQWSSMTWVCSTASKIGISPNRTVSMVFNDLSLLNPCFTIRLK